MATQLSIDDLPSEVLEFVFSKLSTRERKNVKLVNKQWFDVCNSPSVTKNERISLPYKNLHLFKSPRTYLNLEIAVDYEEEEDPFEPDEEVIQQQNAFWLEHGKSVRALAVGHFQNHYPILSKIMNYCPNITELAIKFSGPSEEDHDFNEVADDLGVNAMLNRLVSFTLSGYNNCAFVTGTAFSRFTQSVTNLKRLKFEFVVDRSEACVSALLALIKQNSQKLTELNFHGCDFVTDSFLDNVFDEIGPQLTDLYLYFLTLSSIDCLTKHAGKFVNLKNLKVDKITLAENSLRGLCLFKNLEFLSVVNSGLTDVDLPPLAENKNLKGLDIRMNGCTSDAILQCFGTRAYPNLIALQVGSITDAALVGILPNLPNLQLLDVQKCEITSAAAQSIITNCKKLTHLSLISCQLDGFNEPANINGLKNLVDLNLHSSEPINVENLRFGKLNTIHLAFCKFTEEELKELLDHCPKLNRALFCYFDKYDMEDFGIVRNTDIFRFRTNGGPNIFYFK